MSKGTLSPVAISNGGPRRRTRLPRLAVSAAGALLLYACGGGSTGGGAQSGVIGSEVQKPGSPGEFFFVDPNEGGNTTRLKIEEAMWGRLVNVHALDAAGNVDPVPAFPDFVIGEDIQTDSVNYRLEVNPVTFLARLIILRERTDPDFRTLLDQAASGLRTITPKNDDGTSAGPFPLVPRNACIVLRFSDMLNDSDFARSTLLDNVRVLTGYSPSVPFAARVLFDPNHGAIKGDFHSTRILIDTTVAQAEAAAMSVPLPINGIGLPSSNTASSAPNIGIHIPTKIVTGSGQFTILTSLSGSAVDTSEGPVSSKTVTRDVVRALRSGNENDTNNGFLRDLQTPQVLGSWPVNVLTAVDDPAGTSGFDVLLDVQFLNVCRDALTQGDVLELGPNFLEVSETTAAPDATGLITGVRARNLTEVPFVMTTLLGQGTYLPTFDPNKGVPSGCWLSFTPTAQTAPTTEVSTTSVVSVRFSEPMDPNSLTALDSFLVVNGDSSVLPDAKNLVVGIVQASPDLDTFAFTPSLPFAHTQGSIETYHVHFDRKARDLAGNELLQNLPDIEFTIDDIEPTSESGGISFRFNSLDELEPISADPVNMPTLDIRGQIHYDLASGKILPRSVLYQSYQADRTQTVPMAMAALPLGVPEPLTPLGCRLQALWRYCDFGWQAGDESKHNLDVIGLSWSPVGGNVTADFYENFEIVLGHSTRLPDEALNGLSGGALEPKGGLLGNPSTFDDNVLTTGGISSEVVHPRSLGYQVSPIDLFVAASGTTMLPYPMNRGGTAPVHYLWRDTGSRAAGDSDISLGGIPLNVELALGAAPTPEAEIPNGDPITTFALPLLMEFRCFPSSTGVGMNAFDVSVALPPGTTPNFRAFSAGGTDQSSNIIRKDPDAELVPSGGYNPFSSPPGMQTLGVDNIFYIGQIDTVTRVSRAHTIWLDTETDAIAGASYTVPVVEPDPSFLPQGTQVLLDFRGATGFSGNAGPPSTVPFEAASLDYYGEIEPTKAGGPGGSVTFLTDGSWSNDIRDSDGARYLQVRLTFINNVQSGLTAEVSALGIPFTKN